jgi:hypothetical protein
MHDLFCTSLRRLSLRVGPLAAALALLAQASLVAAQATPAPAAPTPPAHAAPAQAAPAAPPQAAPPAPPPGYPAAPPPQQPYYAPAQQPQPYYAPGQGYAAPQGYAPPQGAYQQPYAPAPYSSYPSNGYRGPLRPRRGMMITGASILGGSYLLSMFVGSIVLDNRNGGWDSGETCDNCRAVGRWLFVPLAGPFIAMSQTDEGDPGLWLLGMLQLVGAGLTTGGIIRYQNSKQALEAQGLSWNLGRDKKLTLDVQSGLRSVGPRMRIDF